ncbi:hypothetical protein HRR83_002479 [Exophiala dermatitidis]|uniref:Uncharacterized protein n=2 Tax=Exophiala dermatitidis TaxID=5970 RepID=H6C0R6_EXODN|nr:uncharacterized protein HMPREF1120_04522 [Exophiala dermatitidis NIH/UT8656]KAJ4520474.1 hypothetical protein HRR75_002340 [Exophiala dermatitidis]EHY56440.1 hypothetical protein HMPREF1120_04522 [Exophiala dermatitidis NIH/UT8656]KAJ4524358.1 hypothetical protein HRR74_002556 [Exophiala dermatitidis]KAJ4525370.1 hypothetical protein HRR73_002099 [Exophiala dermatitidis]KAJ4536683.1 hypothetical protein HRR76_004711 [Exophiala dermatitidis]
MSYADSTSSQSSLETDSETPLRHSPPLHPELHPSRRPFLNASLQRPLPELPRWDSSGSNSHRPAAFLQDRPLPVPTSPQTPEERRQSLIALDRKRRLTNTTYDEGRMRSNSGGYYDRRSNLEAGFRVAGPSSPSPRPHALSDVTRPLPEIIDLTGSSPPTQPRTPPRERRRSGGLSGSARQYVVPRWQPDSEVSECPICKRPFTWMFRRHHCRKCGRVVCNDCSPHRITIPRQFIVRPPGADVLVSPEILPTRHTGTVDLTAEDNDEDPYEASPTPGSYAGSQLEGGEKVRLCNPCVPDPQPDFPPNQTHFGNATTPQAVTPWRDPAGRPNFNERLSNDDIVGSGGVVNGSLTRPAGGSFPRSSAFGQNHNDQTYGRDSGLSWFGSYREQPSPTGRRLPRPPTSDAGRGFSRPLSDNPLRDGRYNSTMTRPSDPDSRQPRHEPSGSPASRYPYLGNDRVSARVLPSVFEGTAASRPPRLDENDFCPICRRILPPKGPNGDERDREMHIMECISARDPSYRAQTETGEPSQARIHMLPFTATEKDCVGQDGSAQECSICMVEYNVGDELARLECLCKFHKECIVEWLGHKAECPVHKVIT